MKHRKLERALWLSFYLFVMGCGLWGLQRARNWALNAYAAPTDQAGQRQKDWDRWRQTARQQAAGKGPVQRRVPPSDQPPTLVLLRDYYGMCISAWLLFGSVLYFTFVFLLRGIYLSPGKIRAD